MGTGTLVHVMTGRRLVISICHGSCILYGNERECLRLFGLTPNKSRKKVGIRALNRFIIFFSFSLFL